MEYFVKYFMLKLGYIFLFWLGLLLIPTKLLPTRFHNAFRLAKRFLLMLIVVGTIGYILFIGLLASKFPSPDQINMEDGVGWLAD